MSGSDIVPDRAPSARSLRTRRKSPTIARSDLLAGPSTTGLWPYRLPRSITIARLGLASGGTPDRPAGSRGATVMTEREFMEGVSKTADPQGASAPTERDSRGGSPTESAPDAVLRGP